MKSLLQWLADVVLGELCRLGCGQRVYPKDVVWHEDLEHAGEQGLICVHRDFEDDLTIHHPKDRP